MIGDGNTLDTTLVVKREFLYLAPEVRLRLDPFFYSIHGYGTLGLMPKDILISEDNNSGVEDIITEELGVERLDSVTMMCVQGGLGALQLRYVSTVVRADKTYILRHGKFKRDDLFVFYLMQNTTPVRIGLCDVNFEEEAIPKLLGLGIYDEFQMPGHAIAFLAAVERECAKNNVVLLLHDPVMETIPFYVNLGYRLLEYPNGSFFAKFLNPTFDERALLPSR